MLKPAPACVLVSLVALLTLTTAGPLQAQELYKGPKDLPQYVLRLPKYCYAQYFDISLWNDPEFSIVAACGGWMNHFCPGLLNLMRAERPKPAGWPKNQTFDRKSELRWGRENVQYTLAHMQSDCRYRDDVNAALLRAKALESIVR